MVTEYVKHAQLTAGCDLGPRAGAASVEAWVRHQDGTSESDGRRVGVGRAENHATNHASIKGCFTADSRFQSVVFSQQTKGFGEGCKGCEMPSKVKCDRKTRGLGW